MSKTIPTDDFNKELFAQLLKEAKGSRSQAEFASECGLSVSNLNRYYNERKDDPPIPSTIEKIASNAQNGVTYDSLMNAAGYNTHLMTTSRRLRSYDRRIMEDLCIAQIIRCLSRCKFSWTESSMTDPDQDANNVSNIRFDLAIGIDDSKVLKEWLFKVKYAAAGVYSITELKRFYGEISVTRLDPNTKISIVVTSEDEYDRIKKCPPFSLHAYMSVILYDEMDRQIKDEEYLTTALDLPPELKNVFSLKGKQ